MGSGKLAEIQVFQITLENWLKIRASKDIVVLTIDERLRRLLYSQVIGFRENNGRSLKSFMSQCFCTLPTLQKTYLPTALLSPPPF